MSVENELRARLIADGAVGGLVATRIFAMVLPQNPAYPAVTFQRISGPRIQHLTGASGRVRARIQYSCWAETYIGAQALATAVRASLDGFIGTLTTVDVVSRLENEIDNYDDTVQKYRVIQDYSVNHAE